MNSNPAGSSSPDLTGRQDSCLDHSLPENQSSSKLGYAWSSVKNGASSASSAAFNAAAWFVPSPVANGAKAVYSGSTVASKCYYNVKAYLVEFMMGGIQGKNPVSDGIYIERLKKMDVHNQLPAFSDAVAAFVLDTQKKAALKQVKPENSEKISKQIDQDIEFYSDKDGQARACIAFFIHRILAYLACDGAVSKDETGQLVVNIIKNLFRIVSSHLSADFLQEINDYYQLHVQQHKDKAKLARLEARIEELTALKADIEGIQDEINEANSQAGVLGRRIKQTSAKMEKERNLLILQLKPLIKELLYSSGLREDVLDCLLEGNNLKGRFIEWGLKWLGPKEGSQDGWVFNYIFDKSLKNAGFLLDVAIEAKLTLGQPQAVDFSQVEGFNALKKDLPGIVENLMPAIFGSLGDKGMQSMLAHIVKDCLDDAGIYQIDRCWIENLLECISKNNHPFVDALWKLCHEIVTPRLCKALGHAASADPETKGNVFDCLITNVIALLVDFFKQNQQLYKEIEEFDKANMMFDALIWRNRYLKEIKGVSRKDCDLEAANLTSDDIDQIYEMAGYSRDRQIELVKAALKTFNCASFEYAKDVELSFFQGGKIEETIEMREACLAKSFGPLSDQLLNLLGLGQDADFALPGATGEADALYNFDVLRKAVLPEQLLNLFRHMSDFYGYRQHTSDQAEEAFGENFDTLQDLATVFARFSIDGSKNYIRSAANASQVVRQINAATGYFPASEKNLVNTIMALAAENLDGISKHDQALKEVDRHLEKIIQACLMKVFLAFSDKAIPQAEPQSEALDGFVEIFRNEFLGIHPSDGMPEDTCQLISQILGSIAGLFAKHRTALQDGMKDYWVIEKAKEDAESLAADEKEKIEKMFKKILERKLEIFKPISLELLELSGLTSKDFGLPEQAQKVVWEMIGEQLQVNLAKLYIDLTTWERTQKSDAARLKEIGLAHAPGASAAFSRIAMRFTQSMLAVDNAMISEAIYANAAEFLKSLDFVEGTDLADKLDEDQGLEFKQMISQNISQTATDDRIKVVLLALENYIQPIIQKTILGLGENLNKVQGHNCHILKKLAKDMIIFSGEHFKKIHAVAIRENKKKAFQVDPIKMLETVTSDEDILGYVILKEKEAKAFKLLHEKNKLWSLTKNGKAEIAKNIEQVEQDIRAIRRQIKEYVRPKWSDEGIAVEKYLKAERTLRRRESQLRDAQNSLRQRWENMIHRKNPPETKEVKAARRSCLAARKHLDKMKEFVDAVSRQNAHVLGYLALKAKEEKARNLGPRKLAAAKRRLDLYVTERWTDGGKAIQEYVGAKKNYRRLMAEYRAIRRRPEEQAGFEESETAKIARLDRDLAKSQLEKAALALAKVSQNKSEELHADVQGKLINLCLDKEYVKLEEKLAMATDESERQAVQEELNKYALEAYYKPLAKKLAKLANENQFLDLPIPEALKDNAKMLVDAVKCDILPSALATTIETICKPETLMGIVLSALKAMNESAENPVAQPSAPKRQIAPDDEFDNECGNMLMDAIEMGALGIEGDIFSLAAKMMDLQGSAGKALGTALREYLESQSLVSLLETAMTAGPAGAAPDGKWLDNGEFAMADKNPLPLNRTQANAVKAEQQAALDKLNREIRQELAKLAENNIKAQANFFLSKLSAPWEKFRLTVHTTIDRFAAKIDEAFGIDCQNLADRLKEDFDEFSVKIYAVISSLISLVASIVIWPIIRLGGIFYNFLKSKVENIQSLISMPIHKRLFFQCINISINAIENELAEISEAKLQTA